jgi:hypothetical protein
MGGMRRCLWGTPYPRTMKSLTCALTRYVPALYPHGANLARWRPRSRTMAVKASPRCVASLSSVCSGSYAACVASRTSTSRDHACNPEAAPNEPTATRARFADFQKGGRCRLYTMCDAERSNRKRRLRVVVGTVAENVAGVGLDRLIWVGSRAPQFIEITSRAD